LTLVVEFAPLISTSTSAHTARELVGNGEIVDVGTPPLGWFVGEADELEVGELDGVSGNGLPKLGGTFVGLRLSSTESD
jgi:hypothetical protein